MKYFLDTEFIENGMTIDLISIGVVADDGREYYAINSECDFSKASDWVLQNVLHPMGLDETGFSIGNCSESWVSANYKNSYSQAKTKDQIAFDVMAFLKQIDKQKETTHTFESLKNLKIENKPEIWGYYADYDWVVFCWLFGTMSDLPKSFPMYCRDIKQFCDDIGNPRLPEQGKGEHNALADAKWNKSAWEFLQSFKISIVSC